MRLSRRISRPQIRENLIPLPDFVLDELVLAKERYADINGVSKADADEGYIWHRDNLTSQ